jgi:hypothetical protein
MVAPPRRIRGTLSRVDSRSLSLVRAYPCLVGTVRDGKVSRIEFYLNRAEGLAAAGFAE